MNAHRSIGFLAAALVTVAQALVFAADTAAVAQNSSDRGGYESNLNAEVSPQAHSDRAESGAPAVS